MNRNYIFGKIATLIAAVMTLSVFPGAAAEETPEITVTNNMVYTEITSARNSSILISADMKKTEDASVFIKVYADDETEIADVSVDEALTADEYKTVKLIVHKNSGSYKLYRDDTLVKSGSAADGVSKRFGKAAVIAKGTAYVKNMSISDYMKTSFDMQEVFRSDFSQMQIKSRIATAQAYDGYCDDWYASSRMRELSPRAAITDGIIIFRAEKSNITPAQSTVRALTVI